MSTQNVNSNNQPTKRTGGDPEARRASKRVKPEPSRGGVLGSILSKSSVEDASLYKPKSAYTAGVYKEILGLLQGILSGESSETLCEAAHEVISAMKSDEPDQAKRQMLNEISSAAVVTDDLFSTFFRLCGLISDFQLGGLQDVPRDGSNEIAVVFDEEDENNPVHDESSGDEADLPAPAIQSRVGIAEPTLPELPEEVEESVKPTVASTEPRSSLDVAWSEFESGLWLKRELVHAGYSEDAVVSFEESVLGIIRANLSNNSVIENKLFQLFKFKELPLCKLIVWNKFKLWLAAALLANPAGKDELISQLLELTDPRASELFRELSSSSTKSQPGTSPGTFPPPSSLLDLSTLVFEQGGRLMSNPSFKPVTKTFQVSKKNYDEVHVQAPEKVQVKSTDLVSVAKDLPDWAQPAFAGFKTLNPVQSKVYPVAFGEFTENLLMCAPTGAGKTNVAMLAIMNVLSQYRVEESSMTDDLSSSGAAVAGTFRMGEFKIVYIAPMKALVQEVVKSFSQRLSPLGLSVKELSGDANLSREEMSGTQVIVTTPEKWDVVTRNASESSGFTQLVRLLIIDEVHLLHDSRGPVIEAVVARTIRQIERTRSFTRIVALSATLPNYQDVALFLRVNLDRGLFVFGPEYRPVPLEQTYIGITTKKGLKRAAVTNEVVFEKVMEQAAGQQILVFVHGRKETGKTARELRNLAMEQGKLAQFLPADSASKGILDHEAGLAKTAELKDLLPFGIGVHHAGLPQADRAVVEDLFAARHLSIVVCTLTLAWGVNLPAHTVIIKGTQIYVPEKGDWAELSPMDMMQMMGRAGRPQYDTSGLGIIITNKSELQYYLSLNNTQLPIESQLVSVLPDVVNAELALGSVGTRGEVAQWLAYTYLFVRMLRNPGLYGLSQDELGADPQLVQRRVDLAHAALTALDQNGLCKYDRRSGDIQATPLGRVAARFYLRSESVAIYRDHLKPTMSDMDLLRLFSLSVEFKYIPVREEEKVELAKLVELVPIPIKGGAEDAGSKINVLLQAYISRLSLEGFALVADMVFVTQNAGRLFRALFEIAVKRGWAALARRCLDWCKMVHHRMWPVQSVLRQFRTVSDEVCRKIERKNLTNEELSLLSPSELNDVIRLGHHAGRVVHQALARIPKIEANAYVQPLSRSTLFVRVDIQPQHEPAPDDSNSASDFFWLFLEDGSQQHCLYSDQFSLRPWQVREKTTISLSFTVGVTDPLPPFYFLRIVADKWIGAETLRAISFRHLVLPEKSLPPTQLTSLPARRVDDLFDDWTEARDVLARLGVAELNSVQNNVFDALYMRGDNVLLAGPIGAGRGVSALFAVLRCVKEHKGARVKIVYIAPMEAQVELKAKEWRSLLSLVGLRVEALTGESGQDVSVCDSADVILASAAQWDAVSRKWRTKRGRALFESIKLVIADHLHLIDSAEFNGPLLELVVSRMRYISASSSSTRMLGLSSSVSNAQDLANWIGATETFAYQADARASPLEVVIHCFDAFNRNVRQQSMLQPMFNHITKRGEGVSTIVFATDKKQTRLAAAELLLQAVALGRPFMFLPSAHSELTKRIRDPALRTSVESGIGYIHSALCVSDRELVHALFQQRSIGVVVVEHSLVWGLGLRASLVIVLDTSAYSVSERQYVDYRPAEVMEMLGASTKVGVLMCASGKRELYKKFVYESLPIESVLDEAMIDFVNAEICAGSVKSMQDCVDWLTWTMLYRRVRQNPNFYSLQGSSHQHVSEYLSSLVEETVEALVDSGMVTNEDEQLVAGDLGLVACYYSVKTVTIELFRRSVQEQGFKRKHLIALIAQAAEFALVPTHSEEATVLSQISDVLGLADSVEGRLGNAQRGQAPDPHAKTLVLMYAHFNRIPLSIELASDLADILPVAHKLVLALVDVVATRGWLKVALSAMEIAPMLVQAVLPSASPLLQLPHMDLERCEAFAAASVEDVVDLLAMAESDRAQLLSGLTEAQVSDIAAACNAFPSIQLSYSVQREEDNTEATVVADLEREGDVEGMVRVVAPRYPKKQKEEGWWLLLASEGRIEDLKRITISRQKERVELHSTTTTTGGEWKVLLMSDSYVGCDQEEEITSVNSSE